MKKMQEIIGLRIISIADGTQMGQVKDLVLNAQGGLLEFIIVDQPSDYFGAKVIAFADILGIGEFAVTIPTPQVIQDVAQNAVAQELLREGVRVKTTKVLTKKGQLIGEVEEIVIDEESGRIADCLYNTPDGRKLDIRADQVITYGKELLIVEVPLPERQPVQQEFSESRKMLPDEEAGAEMSSNSPEGENGFNLFEQRQLQYFVGKMVEKEISLDNGELLSVGEMITEETTKKINKRDTLMEITAHLQKF